MSGSPYLFTSGSGGGTSASSTNESTELTNLALSTSVSGNALTIALKGKDGNDPSVSNEVLIAFRDSTITSGVYVQRSVTAALSVVVSSGSTLGTASAVASYLYVYALDNGGTVELAVINGYVDQGSVQTTTAEGGAGAADSAFVLYSTAARTSKAVRLIGRILITEATAGTWASNATELTVFPFPDTVSVNARYYSCATALTSGATADLVFTVKDWDSHNQVSSATFTARATGKYSFKARIQAGSSWTSGNSIQIWAEKNGSAAILYGYTNNRIDATVSGTRSVISTDDVQLNAGDTLKMRINVDGTSPTISGTTSNYFTIFKSDN